MALCYWGSHPFLAINVGFGIRWSLAGLNLACWARRKITQQKSACLSVKLVSWITSVRANYLSEGLASIKAGARNEAGRSVWHGDKEVYGKVGWSSRSTPSGSTEIPQGQLALKLWQSGTCLSFSVLPVFCLEHNKKLICMWSLQFHKGTNDWVFLAVL